MPFAGWQALGAVGAARELQARVAALPDPLRRAAVAWLRPEGELVEQLATVAPAADRPLAGMPYFLKDLFDLTGVPTRAGSTFLDQLRPLPSHDCQLAQRLGELGAGCAGKSHLVEFASGLTGENPHYGDCPHPFHPQCLSGGSSSGSAALVAAGVAPLSIGTDTGGSVRVPAAWCGLHGFRLSPGDAFIRDAFPLAPTMDTAGWFTANAPDMLTAWRALVPGTGRPLASEPRGCYLNARKLLPGMDPTVATACDYAAASLTARADPVAEASLVLSWHHAVEAYITIGMSEAHTVHRDWLVPHRERYDPIIWRRFTDAGSFPAADIARAHERRREIISVLRDFFRTYDYLVLPSVSCAAPTKAEATLELRRNILTLCSPASLAGLPVLSLPVALPSGLTAGLQIILPSADSPVVPWLLGRS
ncbi:amidase [Lacunisphaera limnophila]|uniref:amidase n=1 Tax=Lacunisphaera limnophila TaxID=1838286 RepID=UPI001F3B22C2|nr:amidase [Lacunisphaera limnophila]